MSEKNRKLFFVAVFALVFYVFGASCVESFVNYYTWSFIGADEFQAYHNALSPRIVAVMVIPWLVEICLTFVLMRLRPSAVPVSAIATAQTLNFVAPCFDHIHTTADPGAVQRKRNVARGS